MANTALRFHEFGDPLKVLRQEDLPIGPPGPGQVVIRMLASPINPSDLGSIAGTYGELPALPAVAGREGIGEILEQGPGADALPVGRRVLLPEDLGSWRRRIVAEADALVPVPDGVPVEQAAMAGINPPTAWLLLENFVRLQPGDWIIQNAANSAVGHYVIQLCRERGVRTINLVRDAARVDPLRAAGGDLVLLDDPELPRKIRELTGGNLPRLGLNSVGGKSAISLIKCLEEGGALVTFGGMTGEPVRFPTRALIFHDVRLAGFWLHRWKARNRALQTRELLAKILELMKRKTLHAPVEATYPLKRYPEAMEHASSPGRRGKVLFSGEM